MQTANIAALPDWLGQILCPSVLGAGHGSTAPPGHWRIELCNSVKCALRLKAHPLANRRTDQEAFQIPSISWS